jgi:hypothetical protein
MGTPARASYQTDPGTLGLGAFVDDASVSSGGDTLSETSFEDGLGGWTVPGALPGSRGNANDWARAQSIGLVDGPGVRTGHSIMWGFGLEAVDGADKRAALLRNASGVLRRQRVDASWVRPDAKDRLRAALRASGRMTAILQHPRRLVLHPGPAFGRTLA